MRATTWTWGQNKYIAHKLGFVSKLNAISATWWGWNWVSINRQRQLGSKRRLCGKRQQGGKRQLGDKCWQGGKRRCGDESRQRLQEVARQHATRDKEVMRGQQRCIHFLHVGGCWQIDGEAFSKPFSPKPEIQHDWRGRGMPTLTWEEVTGREGKRLCCNCSKKEIMGLGFYLKVIFSLWARNMCIA